MLDSAGRLQIPKDYLQRVNIKSRVTLEVTEEGILIRAAGDDRPRPLRRSPGRGAGGVKTHRPQSRVPALLDRVLNVVNPQPQDGRITP